MNTNFHSSYTENIKIKQLKDLFKEFLDLHESISHHLPSGLLRQEVNECRNWIEKLNNKEFPIAFFSVFSSGKSSIINAILEKDILPTGVDSTTPFPFYIRNGDSDRALIIYKNSTDKSLERESLEELKNYDQAKENMREEIDNVRAINIYLKDTKLPDGFVLVDLPGVSVSNLEHLESTKNFVENNAKAFVICKEIKDVSFDNQDEKRFFDAIMKTDPTALRRSFLLINKWDGKTTDERQEATEKLNKAIEKFHYSFSADHIYKVSARNFLRLCQIRDNPNGSYRDVDGLNTYGGLDAIKSDPTSLIDTIPELQDFKRFKLDLINYINTTAVADLKSDAIENLSNTIDKLFSELSSFGVESYIADEEQFQAEYKDHFIDRKLREFKDDIERVLDNFEKELSRFSPPIWSDQTQKKLLSDIRQLFDEGEADKILTIICRGGDAVPETPQLITTISERIRRDFIMVEALEKSARVHDTLNKIKYDLQKTHSDIWTPELREKVENYLQKEYISMRIHGVIENVRPWDIWNKSVAEKFPVGNHEEAIDHFIGKTKDLFSEETDRLRERVARTIKNHFFRYVIPNLKEIFGLQRGTINDLTPALRSHIRALIDQPNNEYYNEYQEANGSFSVIKETFNRLHALKEKLH